LYRHLITNLCPAVSPAPENPGEIVWERYQDDHEVARGCWNTIRAQKIHGDSLT
jgi:hypothetical protein